MKPSDMVHALSKAKSDYDGRGLTFYDEVFDQVADRIAQEGAAGKLDIAALVAWKRLNASTTWVAALMRMPDADVMACTRRAVEIVNDDSRTVVDAAHTARQVLTALPGGGGSGAVPSAILTAAAPQRMAVYDRRARLGLNRLEIPFDEKPGSVYGRYMAEIENLRDLLREHDHLWTAREVDLALFTLGE